VCVLSDAEYLKYWSVVLSANMAGREEEKELVRSILHSNIKNVFPFHYCLSPTARFSLNGSHKNGRKAKNLKYNY